jgi:hypothetical protein
MINWIVSGLGLLVFIAGLVWMLSAWLAKPQGKQAVKIVDALTPGDLAAYIANIQGLSSGSASQPSQTRLAALEQSDALMTYFETIGSIEGQKAVLALVQSIMAVKETK